MTSSFARSDASGSLVPRVTVLIAVRNEARFVARAIDSVLAQTYPAFTVLIVDDASTDGTKDIVNSCDDARVRVIDNEAPRGLPASLNRGLALTDTEYVARFDGNDICFPTRLAAQVSFMDRHPDVAVLGTQGTFIDVAGRPMPSSCGRRPTTDEGLRWWHIFDNPLIHQATLFRTAVIRDELGGYDERLQVGEDSDLWRRVAVRHRLANLQDPLVAVRIDPGSACARLRSEARSDYARSMRPIVHARLQQTLDWPDAPEEWTGWWIAAKHESEPLSPRAVRGLMHAFEVWAARFTACCPAAGHDADVRHHRATMLARVARHAALSAPFPAASTWLKAARLDRHVAGETLPALLAHGIGGRRMIDLGRRMRLRRID